MLTQFLTTREPDEGMIEVALSSFRRVEEEEDGAAGGPREEGD
jgi:uncharacterized protein YqhQ